MSQDNPYQAPDAPLTEDPVLIAAGGDSAISPANTGPANLAELAVVVGPKASTYLGKWGPFVKDPSPKVGGFNGAAFLFSGFWLPYRKMYGLAWILYGVIVAETLVEAVASRFLATNALGIDALGRLFGLVVSIVCGVRGYRWYLDHCRRVVERTRIEAREANASDAEYAAMLARRGGTSALAGFGMFLLFLVVTVVLAVALDPELFSDAGVEP